MLASQTNRHPDPLAETSVDPNAYAEAICPDTRSDPSHIRRRAKLGQITQHVEKREWAIVAYTIRLVPEFERVYNKMGIVLEQMFRYSEAPKYYQKAGETNPDQKWYWYNFI